MQSPQGSGSGAQEEVPPPPPPFVPEEQVKDLMLEAKKKKLFANTLEHLLTHTPSCSACDGCRANARDKRHVCGSFDCSDPQYEHMITLDHTTISDKGEKSTGIGNFKYGIVIAHPATDYWVFVPTHTQSSKEGEIAFKRFIKQVGVDTQDGWVYADGHATLAAMTRQAGLDLRCPPPKRPDANAVVERKVGTAVQGIRAALVSAGLPNCFWPFVGHALSVNHTRKVNPETGFSPFEKVIGDTVRKRGAAAELSEEKIEKEVQKAQKMKEFIPGELVFFKPAKTIGADAPVKIDPRLRAGVFLDYYMTPEGEFTDQYICMGLEDFEGKSMYRHTDRSNFRLHLHRTEVVRRPESMTTCIFPLKRKYYKANYTLRGLERKNEETDLEPLDNYEYLLPAIEDEGAWIDEATHLRMSDTDYTFWETHKRLEDGRIVPMDPVSKKWLAKPRNTPRELWDSHPDLRVHLRRMALDTINAGAMAQGSKTEELTEAMDTEDRIIDKGPLQPINETPRKTIRRMRKEYKRRKFLETAGLGTDDLDQHVGQEDNDDVLELSEDSGEDIFQVDEDEDCSSDDDAIVPRRGEVHIDPNPEIVKLRDGFESDSDSDAELRGETVSKPINNSLVSKERMLAMFTNKSPAIIRKWSNKPRRNRWIEYPDFWVYVS